MKNTDAGAWMKANGHTWGKPKPPLFGEEAKRSPAARKRLRRATNLGQRKAAAASTIRDFVRANTSHKGTDCLFVPGAQGGVASQVPHCGKNIAAARYMLLLTAGTPPSEGMVARHRCGNGHLSCVNPAHLVWGAPGDNIGDMVRHHHAGDNVQDRINSIPE